ncbi:rrm domain-containing [Pyrenophora seminiperda CCB06]|uniref:Rrm domain-containing n=1 Tax=Pyrenophora seminiperda CCB06 TaxID=1302712 RepID=A0A3M7MCK0_9PLEO|nr:rrm domain-containing [Pyrenophora seminiperda CCB06]
MKRGSSAAKLPDRPVGPVGGNLALRRRQVPTGVGGGAKERTNGDASDPSSRIAFLYDRRKACTSSPDYLVDTRARACLGQEGNALGFLFELILITTTADMADDDNFDIDIYGDEPYQDSAAPDTNVTDSDTHNADPNATTLNSASENIKSGGGDQTGGDPAGDAGNGDGNPEQTTQQIASTGGSAGLDVHKQAPQQQGTKRKQGEDDDRPTDPGATAALMINDVNWWISEEDIRGWANQSGCEDELVEVTFNEHKVNGKSKGQVFALLNSPQAATALKHQIENLFKDQAHTKKPTAIFSMNNFGGGFNRGGMMGGNMRGGMGNRGRGGNMGMNPMGGGPMGGMNMPMGGNMMGMGANMMGMGGGNMGMMGGMGGGFGGNPGFNPGFFNGNQGGNDGSWQNPHGAKRPRPE